MIGRIVKGKTMDKAMHDIVLETLGSYASEQFYFLVNTDTGILIYEVQSE